jgi:hypothetical protein
VVLLGYEGYQLQWIFPTKLNPHVSDNAISTYYSTSHITNLPSHGDLMTQDHQNITFQFNQVFCCCCCFSCVLLIASGVFFFALQFCAFKSFVIFLRFFLKKKFSN